MTARSGRGSVARVENSRVGAVVSGQAEVVLGDVEHHLAVASDAARAGGAELVSWAGRFSVREKGRADLVTDADHASQAAVVAVLDAAFPEYAFLGEEGLSREGA
ncbi:MAG: inositol monophosphatase family protein, partial [Planctomycetota bacterium]